MAERWRLSGQPVLRIRLRIRGQNGEVCEIHHTTRSLIHQQNAQYIYLTSDCEKTF